MIQVNMNYDVRLSANVQGHTIWHNIFYYQVLKDDRKAKSVCLYSACNLLKILLFLE